jgi:hypothetical protein
MTAFKFQVLIMENRSAEEWLRVWSESYQPVVLSPNHLTPLIFLA